MQIRLAMLIIPAVFGLLLFVEQKFPLRRRGSVLFTRLVLNLVLSLLAYLTAAVLVRPASVASLDWTATRSFGLFHWIGLPRAVEFVLGFLLLDLSFYWWHVANHRIPFLWRFHNVHHFDPDLDVSTGFRFHFGEVGFSTVFRVAQVILLGIPGAVFLSYEVVFQANTLFHHSNIRLPIAIERRLNKLLVTPRMHGIHHSQLPSEANSNYGVVFPWWDRLHRTLGLNIPQSQVRIGVPAYSQPGDNRFVAAILSPFRKQRPYWHFPDGSTAAARLTRPGKPQHLAE